MTITLFNNCLSVQCIPDPQMWHRQEGGRKIIKQNCAKMVETIEYIP